MTDAPLPAPIGAIPGYPDLRSFVFEFGAPHLYEGDGWKKESMSWKDGCYIAVNLSGPMETTYSGPGAQEFLSRLSINNVYKWKIGSSKHLVMVDKNGLIVSHGLAVRDSEESFRQLAAYPWPAYIADQYGTDGLEVEVTSRETFILQIAGPRSRDIIEKALGEDISDLAFLAMRPITLSTLDGDREVELSRIGMTDGLAYEIRGAFADGPASYDAIYRAGKEFGVTRLGGRTYPVNHTEGGFPQISYHFDASSDVDETFVNSEWGTGGPAARSGSIDPADDRARFRTPLEVNWAWMGKFDHDFVGREAMEAEAANPKRKTVILRWNKEDVLDIYASQFEPGEEYKYIEFPVAVPAPSGGHADRVTIDGTDVGISASGVYSYYYRELISQSIIDIEHAEIGTEVVVHWGDFGGRIKEVRATVARFPYIDLPSNRDLDVKVTPAS